MLKGALTAVVSSLLVAMLFAYVFRFPVPFAGVVGPLGGINPYDWGVIWVVEGVALGWALYGIMGGLLIVPVFGLIAAFIAGAKFADSKNRNRIILCWSALAGAVPVLFISTLDYWIGAW